MNKKLIVSIIIVNYKVEKELLACIRSIKSSAPKVSYEIIVVDNDEEKSLEKNLKKYHSDVIYIPSDNTGWGGGTNVGVSSAKGEYLYFLNPDTKFLNNALDISIEFYHTHKNVGIVASHLYDRNKKPYTLQGTRELTPLRGLIVYSFLNSYFPNNPISRAFFYKDTKRLTAFPVEIAPLSASMIKADVFKKIGGFDPQFFLYFEEYDLGRRLNLLGLQSYILSGAKVLHYWEGSTKKIQNRNQFLEKSRLRYFTKYFGKRKAVLIEAVLRRDLSALML